VARLELSAALTVNDRTRPILDGQVEPEGIRLLTSAMIPGEIFWRQLKFADFDVSEMSVASLMIATTRGETGWVALPVFTQRAFFHTKPLVRVDAGIERPADLGGKRVGVPEYQQTRAVWTRGVLQDEFGVDPRSVRWFVERNPDRSHGGATGFTPPPGVELSYVPESTDLGRMLLDRELDATLYHYEARNLVDRALTKLSGRREVRPLFPDVAAEGRRYYASTGIFPINHCLVVRRSLYERAPWVALNLFNAFEAAKEADAKRRARAVATHLEVGLVAPEVGEALATNLFPYGVRANRHTLETIARYLREQGLTEREVRLEELFPKPALDL
jgi:4,5-dihydroxyphthalate decarboxylase